MAECKYSFSIHLLMCKTPFSENLEYRQTTTATKVSKNIFKAHRRKFRKHCIYLFVRIGYGHTSRFGIELNHRWRTAYVPVPARTPLVVKGVPQGAPVESPSPPGAPLEPFWSPRGPPMRARRYAKPIVNKREHHHTSDCVFANITHTWNLRKRLQVIKQIAMTVPCRIIK